MKPVKWLAAARQQMVSASAHYERERTGLGDQFVAAVRAAIGMIRRDPETGFLVGNTLRMKLVKRFPYGLVFVSRPREILLVAVHHHSQDDQYWKERFDEDDHT